MARSFYHAFEERFRGSRELIEERLRVYLPFVVPLREHYTVAKALDLGCGRGEWIGLLSEAGFTVHGVDVDEDMLADCKEKGFSVTKGDAVEFLASVPDSSYTVISAIHVIEHIPFPALQQLVIEALRILEPGGVLILETPNPENLIVGATNFYLDPTHQRPIPPNLLLFVTEYYGFMRSKLLRLQEPKALAEKATVSLLEVLDGPSPDYGVVAQKGGPHELIERMDVSFSGEFGISLALLAGRFQQSIEREIGRCRAQEVLAQERGARAHMQMALAQEHAARGGAQERQANDTSGKLTAHRRDMVNRYRLRNIRPIRTMIGYYRLFLQGSSAWLSFSDGSRPRRALRRATIFGINAIRSYPCFNSYGMKVVNRYPALKRRLRNLAASPKSNHPWGGRRGVDHGDTTTMASLSPYAQKVYVNIKILVEKTEEKKPGKGF